MGGEIKREEEEVGLVAGGGAGAVLTGAKTLQTIIKKNKGMANIYEKEEERD
jgi:sulfopyruvate decarboxylase TPP-binding subunit